MNSVNCNYKIEHFPFVKIFFFSKKSHCVSSVCRTRRRRGSKGLCSEATLSCKGTVCDALGAFHFLSSFLLLNLLWSYVIDSSLTCFGILHGLNVGFWRRRAGFHLAGSSTLQCLSCRGQCCVTEDHWCICA